MDQLEAVIYQFPMAGRAKAESLTDEAGSVPVSLPAGDGTTKEQPREFLKVGRKILSEAELSSPASRRFMIAEIERLDIECTQLRGVAKVHEDLRVEHASLSASVKSSRWSEILSSTCLMAGSAGLGAAPSYFTATNLHEAGWIVAIGSGLLVAVGVLSRVFR